MRLNIIALLFILILLSQNNFAQKYYFYTNKPYGSESLFNPITLFINGGYDVTQLQSVSNRINQPRYGHQLRTVLRSLGDPFHTISVYGWSHFLRTEFFPISFTKNNMQWVPNYQQHLIGSGMLIYCYERMVSNTRLSNALGFYPQLLLCHSIFLMRLWKQAQVKFKA